jgi:outer membrane protein
MKKSIFGAKSFATSLALLMASAGGMGALTQEAQAESLGDAIAMAYAQNPTLLRARAQQRAADEGYVQARSYLGPSLNAGASTDYADHSDGLGNRSYTGLSLSATQTLFASGGLTASLAASKATVMSGQQSLRSTEQGVLLDVISVYTAVQRDQQALKISQDNYDILKQQLDQTQAQFDAGQLTRTDVAQSQARLAASAASLASAQAQLDTDRATYVAIVGQAPAALDPVPDLPGLPTDLNAALDSAQKNNPDMQAAMYAEQSAADRVRAARSVFGPTIGLSAQSGYTAPTNHLGTLSDNESTSLTARLSIPLFSAGLNGSQVRQAKENLAAQTADVELTRRSVVSTVSQAWSQMLAARSAVTSNEEGVKAAQIAADGVKTEQQVGLRTNIEVLNAEQDLKSAQLSLIESQRNAYVAGSQLLAVTGALDPRAFAPEVEAYDPQANFDKVKNKGWSPLEPVSRLLDGLASGM